MHRLRISIVALLATIAVVWAGGNSAAAEVSRRALLIGVNDYAADKVTDLNGAINDVEQLSHVLQVRFGFPATGITTLLDEQATRRNILATLESFVADTRPNDVVYVHFSGHGSQAPDANGDEQDDERDETIVPHDGRTPGVRDITDDELEAVLSKLPTRNALVVLDSCHSGTGTRSIGLRSRSIPMDRRHDLYAPDATRGTPATVVVPKLDYVLMTGASANQNALDGPIDGKFYGLFSYSLAKSLEAGPAATPAQIMAGVGAQFLRISDAWGGTRLPDPQLEAPADRLVDAVFPALAAGNSGQDSPKRAYLDVRSAGPTTVVLVEGGRFGAAKDSVWGIYGHAERQFRGDALAMATVTRISGDDAVAELDRPIDLPRGARAVEVMPASLTRDVTVDLRADDSAREALIAEISQLDTGIRFVARNRFAHSIIEVTAGHVVIYSADGLEVQDRFRWDGPEQSAARIVDVLLRSQTTATLTSLTNHASEIDLNVSVVRATPMRGIGVSAATNRARYHIRRVGEARSSKNSLMLEVGADRDVYITIAAVNAEGEVGVLFPNGYQNDDFIPNGHIGSETTVRIPDSYAEDNRAGFHWDYVPPAGHDVVQVFASTDTETAREIRRYIEELAAETRTRRASGKRSATADTLPRLRGQLGVRGIGLVPSDVSPSAAGTKETTDWTVSAVRIEVADTM